MYWRCVQSAKFKCTASLTVSNGKIKRCLETHTHDKDYKKIQKCRERKKAMTSGGQLRWRDENESLSEN